MPDAVLVVDKNKDQSVKEAVNILKKKNVTQSEIFPKDHRPWGWFESLALGENFQVKRIVVKSGASLSLQSHRYRSENWVVVSGVAKVTTNNEIKYIKESETAFIPMGAVHRLENESENELIIIEVQTGSYLGEDDIIRYEDNFNRA
ncbi:MAG: phosphomannose isomerase type II C-terminal cupin domain [Paracoccaceae bacterium]